MVVWEVPQTSKNNAKKQLFKNNHSNFLEIIIRTCRKWTLIEENLLNSHRSSEPMVFEPQPTLLFSPSPPQHNGNSLWDGMEIASKVGFLFLQLLKWVVTGISHTFLSPQLCIAEAKFRQVCWRGQDYAPLFIPTHSMEALSQEWQDRNTGALFPSPSSLKGWMILNGREKPIKPETTGPAQ